MRDLAIVVGAGLFGSIIAAQLKKTGREVIIIDNKRPDAGSKPAACLMKPSWFIGGMGKQASQQSLDLLDSLYGVHDIKFKVGPASTTVHWCDPKQIILEPTIEGTVKSITPQGSRYMVEFHLAPAIAIDSFPRKIWADLVVVAAGIWSAELVPIEGGLQGQAGMAFVWPDKTIDQPFISPWAPYKQLVAFNRGDGLWVGDGTAIKQDNWTAEREQASLRRCSDAVKAVGQPQKLFGIRPYTKRKPCYLEEVSPGLWVATGGAKNGTVAAGWCAHEIAMRTQ